MQVWSCTGGRELRDIFGTLGPSSEKATCSRSSRLAIQEFRRCTRQSGSQNHPLVSGKKRHIHFEHINFLNRGLTAGQPAGYPEENAYFPGIGGEHIPELKETHQLFKPAGCPRVNRTLTRAKIYVYVPPVQAGAAANPNLLIPDP